MYMEHIYRAPLKLMSSFVKCSIIEQELCKCGAFQHLIGLNNIFLTIRTNTYYEKENLRAEIFVLMY